MNEKGDPDRGREALREMASRDGDLVRFILKRDRPLSLSSALLSSVLVREIERDERPKMDGNAFPKGLLVASMGFVCSGESRGCWAASWRFEEVSKRLYRLWGLGGLACDESGADSTVESATPVRPGTAIVGETEGAAQELQLLPFPRPLLLLGLLKTFLCAEGGAALLVPALPGRGMRADQRRLPSEGGGGCMLWMEEAHL